MAEKKQPNPIDIAVGARVRMRRMMLGMTQEKLGERLGITFQQVQKYEKGSNRIGASRLQQIAAILEVPVAFFFEDVQSNRSEAASPADPAFGFGESGQDLYAVRKGPGFPAAAMGSDGAALNRAFARISDPRVRQRVVDLVETLAETGRY